MDVAATFSPDVRTLALLLAVVLVLATAVYTALWLQGAGGGASGFWGLAHGIGIAGYVLVALRDVVPDVAAITLANTAIMAGALLLVKGIHTHLGRRYPDSWAIAGLLAFAAAFAYFTHIEPDLGIRIILIAGLGAAVLIWGGVVLLAQPRGARGWVHVYTAVAFFVVAAVNGLRVYVLTEGPGADALIAASTLHAYSFAVVLLAVVAWTLGFFWMIAQGLRQDLAEEVAVRRAQEQSLRESEQRFRAIFATAATGIAFSDPNGDIIEANEAFAQLVGYVPEDLVGRNFIEITHPTDREASAQLHQDLIHSHEDHRRLEKRYATPAGDTVWVDLTVSAI